MKYSVMKDTYRNDSYVGTNVVFDSDNIETIAKYIYSLFNTGNYITSADCPISLWYNKDANEISIDSNISNDNEVYYVRNNF